MKWTHKGWFGFCPVYLADDGDGGLMLTPRRWWFNPLYYLSGWIQQLRITVCSWLVPGYVPLWKFRITGEFHDQ
jgi:hypothetical protein